MITGLFQSFVVFSHSSLLILRFFEYFSLNSENTQIVGNGDSQQLFFSNGKGYLLLVKLPAKHVTLFTMY